MHRTIKRLAIVAAAAIPAVAVLFGTASAAVSPYNKVTNGDFSNGKTGWSVTKAPQVAASISEAFDLGKVSNIENIKVASYAYAYQCFPVMDAVKYELSGKVYIGKFQPRDGTANMAIIFYANDTCANAPLSSAYTPKITESNTWKKQSLTLSAPKGSKSAMVRLLVYKHAVEGLQKSSDPYVAYFDDVQVLQKSLKIPDGPIIQNPQPSPTPPPLPTPPAPQQPDQPQDNPAPVPNPDPAPDPQQPAPQDQPEVVEEDVPGPAVPESPDNGGSDDDGGSVPVDSSNDSNDAGTGDGPANDGGEDEPGTKVETLGSTGQPKPTTNGNAAGGNAPTPAAPETGTGPIEDNGLVGMRELGLMAGGAAGVMVLAFLIAARGRRKQEDDEYIIGE